MDGRRPAMAEARLARRRQSPLTESLKICRARLWTTGAIQSPEVSGLGPLTVVAMAQAASAFARFSMT